MQTGRLNQRVTLQRPVETRTLDGGVSRSWEDVATVWAAVEPVSGKETAEGDERVSRATVRVRIRHYPGIDATWRVAL